MLPHIANLRYLTAMPEQSRPTSTLYKKADLPILIDDAIQSLAGTQHEGKVITLKARTTPNKTARSLQDACATLPEGGIILQPILFNYDAHGNVISNTNRKMNPDGPRGHDHGTLIVFQKGKDGQPNQVTYIDSEGKPMPIVFADELKRFFPGTTINSTSIVQQPRHNKADCGPNIVRNAETVVHAVKAGQPIDPTIFTIPTADDITTRRQQDATTITNYNMALRVNDGDRKAARKAALKKPYTGIIDRLMYGHDGQPGLYAKANADNHAPDMLSQLMLGYIPEGVDGFPPIYTPKSFLAQLGADWIELMFGVKTPGIPSFASLACQNTFAFRDSTLSAKLKGEQWAFEGAWGPAIGGFFRAVNDDYQKRQQEKQQQRDTVAKADKAAELRAAARRAAAPAAAAMAETTPSAPPLEEARPTPSAPPLEEARPIPSAPPLDPGDTSFRSQVSTSRNTPTIRHI